jgi:hypothetical protein
MEQPPRHIFACRPHWFSLPDELRRELGSKWRRLNRTGELADIESYMNTRIACVAWLEDHSPCSHVSSTGIDQNYEPDKI